MEAQKIVVKEGKAVLQCPNCLEAKTISAIRLIKHRFNVRCKCNHVFTVQLEFRRKHRKKTNLTGYYKKRNHPSEWAEIHWESEKVNVHKINCKVINLSSAGIGLIPYGAYDIKVGDFLAIRFVLDDSSQTVLLKRATVRAVLENYVGCEFIEEDKQDKTIGFYLLQ